jgi:hypothetical protein
MPWVESLSPSFRARHDESDADDVERVLHSLELTRDYLSEYFDRIPVDIDVVFHRSSTSLTMARPLVPLVRLLVAPAARRYVAGAIGGETLHVLTPAALRQRASNVAGSFEMLELTAAALYARQVVVANNPDLRRRPLALRAAVQLRWAWLLEGTARWFAGQPEHARPAIARRLREGPAPSFPPGIRDAPLLGGSVAELLALEQGEEAVAELARRLHPQGARAALTRAFRRPLAQTERAWREHLASG